MDEDRKITEATEATEATSRFSSLDLVAKLPFGAQAAVLAGVLTAGAGAGGALAGFPWLGSTCCPPILE